MNDSGNFVIKDLEHVAHYFTSRECRALVRHGPTAADLECGLLDPDSETSQHFVDVCKGFAEPATEFEFLWLRYRQNLQLNQRIADLVSSEEEWRRRAGNFEKGILREVAKRKEACEQFERTIAALQALVATYERQLGIKPEQAARESEPFIDLWREQP